MRPFRFSLLRPALVVALVALTAAGPALAQGRIPATLRLGDLSGRSAAFTPADARAIAPPAWASKLDPSARLLALGVSPEAVFGSDASVMRSADGQPTVDLLVRTTTPGALAAMPGVEVRAVAGDIAVVRAPLGGIEALARSSATLYIEASQTRDGYNDSGRADLRADVVNAGGGGLPRAFNGEGVVVGVVDSGLDVAHPDFLSPSGSRVAFLLELLENGGQTEYTRAQISANPGGIPERDFNGHGTHVTGSATGAGGINPALRGVAAAADIIFVKGNRLNNGRSSFSDTDVIAGVDFIFQRAASLGQPAVVNLSLGGHFGPHDGTSLYEQALTNLGGPGRIVVAAVGNDGQTPVHAGDTVTGGVSNQTFWLAGNPTFAAATMWYDGGVLNQFAIGAFFVSNGQLNYLGEMAVNAGQVLANGQNGVPFVVNGQTIANVIIDAATTNDPRNGDGNVLFVLEGGNGIDLTQIVWSVASVGTQSGRFDVWALGGSQFYAFPLGFPNNEVPGDTQFTVSPPSTALGIIGVAAHVTRNSWTDIDGQFHQSLENDPNNPGGPPIVPALGTLASFSSRGPTRDGRVGIDVSGPGNRIASTLSGHVTIGTPEHPRQDVLQGGGYVMLQGTSMASPHVAGTVALMLQADPSLTPAEVRSILRETGRADGNTGGLPNTGFGYGKADALSAVLRTLQLCAPSCGGGGGTGTTVAEAEPNNAVAQAQALGGGSPITVNGQASQDDTGELTIDYGGGDVDDFEDLFRITTTGAGLSLSLGGFNRDLDLFLLNAAGTQIVAASNAVGESGTETISETGLPAGTYLVAVSYYDGGGPGQTTYQLVATGSFTVDDEEAPGDAALTLAVPFPNPTLGAAEIGFDLPTAQSVRVTVFDVLGREVARLADGDHTAGPHRLILDASALGAGVYTVRLVAGETVRTQRLVVAR